MKVFSLTNILGLSVLPLAWASLTTKSVLHLEACLTESSNNSVVFVPTTTTTYTLSQVATVVSIPQSTITPKASTATVKSTTIVTSTKTVGSVNTFSSTSTAIVTTTTTITAVVTISTQSTSTTTITPTYTVPTSAGQVFASNSPGEKKRNLNAHPHMKKDVSRSRVSTTLVTYYPTKVTCGLLVDIYGLVTSTASSTMTVTDPAPTVKVTSTITGTVTSTNCHASTTRTTTATLSVIATVTTTTTNINTEAPTTVTQTAATTTVYAACTTDNLLTVDPVYSSFGEGYIGMDDYSFGFDNVATVPTNTSYDCCVTCQTFGNCWGAIYDANSGICTIDEVTDNGYGYGSCDPGQTSGSVYDPYESSFLGYTLTNGPCGYFETE